MNVRMGGNIVEFDLDDGEPRKISTIVIRFMRCEMHNARCFVADEGMWQDLRKAIEAAGIRVQEEEIKEKTAWGASSAWHQRLEIINSVFEVQGLKYNEGESILPAIESLVDKYVKERRD